MSTKKAKTSVIQTAEELQAAQTTLKGCRTAEETKEKAYRAARELRIKAEQRKEACLKAHNEAVAELR